VNNNTVEFQQRSGQVVEAREPKKRENSTASSYLSLWLQLFEIIDQCVQGIIGLKINESLLIRKLHCKTR